MDSDAILDQLMKWTVDQIEIVKLDHVYEAAGTDDEMRAVLAPMDALGRYIANNESNLEPELLDRIAHMMQLAQQVAERANEVGIRQGQLDAFRRAMAETQRLLRG